MGKNQDQRERMENLAERFFSKPDNSSMHAPPNVEVEWMRAKKVFMLDAQGEKEKNEMVRTHQVFKWVDCEKPKLFAVEFQKLWHK